MSIIRAVPPRSCCRGVAASYDALVVALLNILFLVLACVAAHLAPAATLVGAYALLGPAHYLTEISWLHDRRYFSARPGWLIAAAVAAAIVIVASPWAGVVTMAFAGACLAAGFGLGARGVATAGLAGGGAALVGVLAGWWWLVAAAVLLPTIVHVFVFTGMFVVSGAVRSRSAADWVVVAGLAMAALSFLLIPCVDATDGTLLTEAGMAFKGMFEALGAPSVRAADAVLGFAGFAYAFHYLNWFAKTRSLGVDAMSGERACVIVILWSLITACYVADVRLGLLVSLPLSFGHVLLELPLDIAVGRKLLADLKPAAFVLRA